MYLANLTHAVALEALYCDSRRSWLLSYANEPGLYLMPRKRWLWALSQAVAEIAAGTGATTLLIDWDSEPEAGYPLN